MIYVYRVKNAITKTYGEAYVFGKDEPQAYFKQLHNLMLLHPDMLVKQDLHISIVECIGTLDVETGDIKYQEIESYNLQEAFDQRKALEAING